MSLIIDNLKYAVHSSLVIPSPPSLLVLSLSAHCKFCNPLRSQPRSRRLALAALLLIIVRNKYLLCAQHLISRDRCVKTRAGSIPQIRESRTMIPKEPIPKKEPVHESILNEESILSGELILDSFRGTYTILIPGNRESIL